MYNSWRIKLTESEISEQLISHSFFFLIVINFSPFVILLANPSIQLFQ